MTAVVAQQQSKVPAHIQQIFGGADLNNDLAGGIGPSFPVISIKGSKWHIVEGGNRRLLTQETTTGDTIPAAQIDVVLVKARAQVSKIYYENGYQDGSDEAPTCFSNDGIRPDPGCSSKQSESCAGCQHNVWGSKITENNKKGKACADARRVAVAEAGNLKNILLLRVPAASLRDLADYGKQLGQRGFPYCALVTKIGFDHTQSYPKLTFRPVRVLNQEEAVQIAEVMKSDVVDAILGVSMAEELAAETPAPAAATMAPAPVAAQPAPAPATAPAAAPATPAAAKTTKPRGKPAPAPATAPAAAPAAPAAAKTTKPRGKPAQAAPAAPAPAPVVSDDEVFAALDGGPAAQAVQQAAPAPAPTPAPAADQAQMADNFDDFINQLDNL